MPEYIKDYNDFFDDYDAEQQRALDLLPKCAECGEPIQDEECFELNEDRIVCPDCLNRFYKKRTEDYIL